MADLLTDHIDIYTDTRVSDSHLSATHGKSLLPIQVYRTRIQLYVRRNGFREPHRNLRLMAETRPPVT
jgi:hypothetical protein